MTKINTIYRCDVCKRNFEDNTQPLELTIRSDGFKNNFYTHKHFCCSECANEYLDKIKEIQDDF